MDTLPASTGLRGRAPDRRSQPAHAQADACPVHTLGDEYCDPLMASEAPCRDLPTSFLLSEGRDSLMASEAAERSR